MKHLPTNLYSINESTILDNTIIYYTIILMCFSNDNKLVTYTNDAYQ